MVPGAVTGVVPGVVPEGKNQKLCVVNINLNIFKLNALRLIDYQLLFGIGNDIYQV